MTEGVRKVKRSESNMQGHPSRGERDVIPVKASRLPLALSTCIWREVAGSVVIPSSLRRWTLTYVRL